MADYIVKDTELTSVANAIRTAGGTSSLLNFPNGFVSAVNNISGGGSSDFSTAEVTVVNSINGHVNLTMPVCVDVAPATAIGVFSPEPNSTTTVNVIMYKGAATLTEVEFSEIEGEVSFSGDIDDGLITGNGTITITESED